MDPSSGVLVDSKKHSGYDNVVVEVKDGIRFALGYPAQIHDAVNQSVKTLEIVSYLPGDNPIEKFFAEICDETYHTICAQNTPTLRTVVDDIGKLWGNDDDADVTFSLEGKTIRAHKLILKARSDYFTKMFSNEWRESHGSAIEIKDTTYKIFEALLFYLYHGRINVTETDSINIFGLMKLADSHCHDEVHKDCEKLLIRNITTENVFFLVRNAPSANSLVFY
ncbi:RCC1 and BTB domain-containing protein 1 [Folsomia candida]|uniref:RCC1 and BTB domain-containing protein 1 n=1 Tax=Folsomia candida TaxID=158441 RepID=A0A226DUT5_FOLCA|nr:RCC1 and BTB domain-containing protein 1 [Folsomia candida]